MEQQDGFLSVGLFSCRSTINCSGRTAVPRGPSTNPRDKRLAARAEGSINSL
jgi:hypothetical protein